MPTPTYSHGDKPVTSKSPGPEYPRAPIPRNGSGDELLSVVQTESYTDGRCRLSIALPRSVFDQRSEASKRRMANVTPPWERDVMIAVALKEWLAGRKRIRRHNER